MASDPRATANTTADRANESAGPPTTDTAAAEMLFRGLLQELPRARAEGRLRQWRQAGIDIIEMLATKEEPSDAE